MQCLDFTTLKLNDYLVCVTSRISPFIVKGEKYKVLGVSRTSVHLESVPHGVLHRSLDQFLKLEDITAYDKVIYEI
jgi:hypothetical protein